MRAATSAEVRLDLHLHSTASDGAWEPSKVVAGAAAGGLDVIALADHDSVAGVAEARDAAADLSVQVVTALEVSSTWEGREIHVLGYFVDPDDEGLQAHGERASTLRERRMREMIERLGRQGVHVDFEDVLREAGDGVASIARPHLAKALVAAGYANSVLDAFMTLIGDDHPAFVPTRLMSPEEAISLILAAGGVPVWAHPPGNLLESLLPTMVEAGLRGLEVYRPTHRPGDVLRLEELCRAHGLLASGGSDWHTPDGGTLLGDFWVEADEVSQLLAAGGM